MIVEKLWVFQPPPPHKDASDAYDAGLKLGITVTDDGELINHGDFVEIDWRAELAAKNAAEGKGAARVGASLIVRASAVKSRSIRWAWEGRLALGYLTVMTGEEGLGKSAFMAWLIARMTLGELPGEWQREPVDVLVIAGEDGIADTWRPGSTWPARTSSASRSWTSTRSARTGTCATGSTPSGAA
ncbi:MAG: AAA family ATPase [Solirubrobacteraceae bacterium]